MGCLLPRFLRSAECTAQLYKVSAHLHTFHTQTLPSIVTWTLPPFEFTSNVLKQTCSMKRSTSMSARPAWPLFSRCSVSYLAHCQSSPGPPFILKDDKPLPKLVELAISPTSRHLEQGMLRPMISYQCSHHGSCSRHLRITDKDLVSGRVMYTKQT